MVWKEDRWAYLSLVLAVVVPGVKPHVFGDDAPTADDTETADNTETADDTKTADDTAKGDAVPKWSETERQLLIDEGRRQLDRQDRRLADLRSRAQLSFTTSLAVIAALVGKAAPFDWRLPHTADLVLTAGLAAAVYSALGAVGLLVAPATMGMIDATDLSLKQPGEPPIQQQLADEYAATVRPGEATIRTRLTVFFEVVIWLLVAAACTAALYAFF